MTVTLHGMKSMSGSVFVDTNILLYARDSTEPEKQVVAERWLEDLWKNRTGRISTQVMNEYFVNITRKLSPGLSKEEAWEDLDSLNAWGPVSVDFGVLRIGYQVYAQYGLSWWDSLIVAAAERSCCQALLSEDLSAGGVYRGIKVINPFI